MLPADAVIHNAEGLRSTLETAFAAAEANLCAGDGRDHRRISCDGLWLHSTGGCARVSLPDARCLM